MKGVIRKILQKSNDDSPLDIPKYYSPPFLMAVL